MPRKTYEEKLSELAEKISPVIKFDSVDEARELIASRLLPMHSEASQRIPKMAENLFEYAKRFEIESMLNCIGACVGTRLSALREAIVRCAEQYITEFELKQLAELGTVDLASRRRVQAVGA